MTTVLGGDVPTQLMALVNGSREIGILSPPALIAARDKYRMEEFSSLQNGVGVLEKNVRDPLVKRMIRARQGQPLLSSK